MDDVYVADEDYARLLDHLLDCRLGEMLAAYRDELRSMLTMALGLQAGVWPESSKVD
ncbi:hypothetical protein M2360_001038 [Rhizobium sp. SG_E_25_P2]|uniref:hypothetical protein n=1 Tax=Rhizobium sp. SG_E_25_P2 TaxID=2879942 RepID=UPI002475CC87|nr:hypothetical protein [Rhizobium sp. SG_E_25_P2]MDH6265648.1 hypothetical protein [Rhizobium sp. SG_E_25_P2]